MRPPLDTVAVPTLLAVSFTLEAVHPHDSPPTAHLPESPMSIDYFPPTFSVSSNTGGGTPAPASVVIINS